MSLKKCRVQLLDAETSTPIEDVDILTSADSVQMADGTDMETKITQMELNINSSLNTNTQEIQKLNGYKTSTDLNDEGEVGKLTVTKAISATLNTPNKQGLTIVLAYVIFTYKNSADYGIQVALASGSNEIFIRKYSTDGWGVWVKNLVNDDSGWINLPLNITNTVSGYTPKYKKVGNECKLSGKLNGVSANSTQIATLPTGFRPAETSAFTTVYNNGSKYIACGIMVQANGNISFISSSDGSIPTSTCEIHLNGIAFYCN